jgi:hypothetical protein
MWICELAAGDWRLAAGHSSKLEPGPELDFQTQSNKGIKFH